MNPRASCPLFSVWPGAAAAAVLTLLLWLMPAAAPAQTPAAPPPPAAEDEDIRPARETVAIPKPASSRLYSWLIPAALVLAVAGAGIWLWKKQSRPSPAALTPPDQARESLHGINAQREILTAGELAEKTGNVVRDFIAGQFGIAAPRRTTEEFLRSLTSAGPSPLTPHLELLEGFLTTCDRAKFGGAGFDPVERFALIETAGRFVQAAAYTGPAPPPASVGTSPHLLPDA